MKTINQFNSRRGFTFGGVMTIAAIIALLVMAIIHEREHLNVAVNVVANHTDVDKSSVRNAVRSNYSFVVEFRYKGEPSGFGPHVATVRDGKIHLIDGKLPTNQTVQLAPVKEMPHPNADSLPKQPVVPNPFLIPSGAEKK